LHKYWIILLNFFVCDAHKCWIVSGFCSQNGVVKGVVTFCESCLLVRFLMNAATLKKKKKVKWVFSFSVIVTF
jgi:hypothetical protein